MFYNMVALDQGNPPFHSGKVTLSFSRFFSIYMPTHLDNRVLAVSMAVMQIWSEYDLWKACSCYPEFISLSHIQSVYKAMQLTDDHPSAVCHSCHMCFFMHYTFHLSSYYLHEFVFTIYFCYIYVK